MCSEHWTRSRSARSYKVDGKPVKYFPADVNTLAKVECEYITMPGWKSSLDGIRHFTDLPKEAQAYIERVEELLDTRVEWISTSPAREDTFTRR